GLKLEKLAISQPLACPRTLLCTEIALQLRDGQDRARWQGLVARAEARWRPPAGGKARRYGAPLSRHNWRKRWPSGQSLCGPSLHDPAVLDGRAVLPGAKRCAGLFPIAESSFYQPRGRTRGLYLRPHASKWPASLTLALIESCQCLERLLRRAKMPCLYLLQPFDDG